MPIYEYRCSSCGELLELMQKMSDPAPARCEKCGKEGTMERQVSRTSFQLKGGGWYSDLYGSSKKGSGSSSGGEAKSDGSSSSTSSPSGGTSSTSSTSTGSPGGSSGSSSGSSSGGSGGGSSSGSSGSKP